MSHFTTVRTKLADAELLVEALRAVGYDQVEVHDQPVALFGYQGDARPQRAEVVIRRKHVGAASNDIGFARGEDGTYSAIISDYDSHRHGAPWLNTLSQEYGYASTLKFAADNGYEVATDEKDEAGVRRVTLRRYR